MIVKRQSINTSLDCIVNFVDCTGEHSNSPTKWLFQRFPGARDSYDKACARAALKPGMVQFVRVDRQSGLKSLDGDLNIVNLAFREEIRSTVDPILIKDSFDKIKSAMNERNLKSIGVPYVRLPSSPLDERHLSQLINERFSGESTTAKFFKLPESQREKQTSKIVTVLESPALVSTLTNKAEIRDSAYSLAERLASRGWQVRTTGCDVFERHVSDGFRKAGGTSELFLPWQDFGSAKRVIAAPTARTMTRVGPTDLAVALTSKELSYRWPDLEDGYKSILASATMAVMGNDLKNKSDLIIFASTSEKTAKQRLVERLSQKLAIPCLKTEDTRRISMKQIDDLLSTRYDQASKRLGEPEIA